MRVGASSASFSPTEPPRVAQQEPLLEPEPMLEPVPAAELGDEPLSLAEKRMLERGHTISLALASIAVPANKRAAFDDPAFEGVPMLDLDDLGDDDEELELDLDAVGGLELEPTALASSRVPPAEPPVEPAPRDAPSEPEPAPRVAPPSPAPVHPAPLPPRARKPSLPLAPVAVELPEGIDTRGRRR